MTTTVTVAAHCSPEKEVRVIITDEQNEDFEAEIITLQDGETQDYHIYDGREIYVKEIEK